jgi:hypothetical protein
MKVSTLDQDTLAKHGIRKAAFQVERERARGGKGGYRVKIGK